MRCASVNNNNCLCLISETIITCTATEITCLIKKRKWSFQPKSHCVVVGNFKIIIPNYVRKPPKTGWTPFLLAILSDQAFVCTLFDCVFKFLRRNNTIFFMLNILQHILASQCSYYFPLLPSFFCLYVCVDRNEWQHYLCVKKSKSSLIVFLILWYNQIRASS